MLKDTEAQSLRKHGRLQPRIDADFGREPELEVLARKVVDPAYPLITITGEGGIGKTRLALALRERVQEHFADGVWFVSLVGVKPQLLYAGASPQKAVHEVLTASIGEVLLNPLGGRRRTGITDAAFAGDGNQRIGRIDHFTAPGLGLPARARKTGVNSHSSRPRLRKD